MGKATTKQAIEAVRASQSGGKLRKESGSALVSLMTWLAVSGAVLIEQVPEEWSFAALVLGALVGAANVYVARFTEPAVTQMQQDRILREVDRVETAEAVAAAPAVLPVYRGESTQHDGVGAYAD